ncbi:MAG: cytochrome c-type biogenesis protein CcmH [Polyangiales bacterium]
MSYLRNALITLYVVFTVAFAAQADRGTRADELYGRLLAPCCWNQTLDIHDSALATQLRIEIAERVARGEQALTIEDDLAERFGPRIRAVPRARDPRQSMALLVAATLTLVLISLFTLAFRWTRQRAASRELHGDDALLAEELRAEYDARLERELSRAE